MKNNNDDKCQCGAELIYCPAQWGYEEDYWICPDCESILSIILED